MALAPCTGVVPKQARDRFSRRLRNGIEVKAVEGHEDVLASGAEHSASFSVRSNFIGKKHDAEETADEIERRVG